MDQSDLLNLDPEKLASHVCAYLLCDRYSLLAAAAGAIVKAARFGLPVKVSGKAGDRYNRVMRVIRQLGISNTEVEYSPDKQIRPWEWASEVEDRSLHVWVPEIKHLGADLGLLMAFYIRLHLAEVRKRAPDFPEPRIDASYILLLWHDYIDRDNESIGARILRDLLYAEGLPVLTVHSHSGGISDNMRTIHGKTRDLADAALMYLGFTSNAELSREKHNDSPRRNTAFNDRTQQFIGAMSPASYHGTSSPHFVWHIRPMTWDVGSLSMAMQNIWHYHLAGRQATPKKAKECLIHRLRGLTEEQIASRMQFGSPEDYLEWARQNRVALSPKEPKDPYQDWLEACDVLGIEPDLADVGAAERQQPCGPQAGSSQTQEPPESAFRYSSDYRSLRLPSGKKVSLTAKQAQVIQMLIEAKERGTPELSQAHIIEEVYGEVRENRLKKLFGDNQVWDLLVESGSKKGLVVLRFE